MLRPCLLSAGSFHSFRPSMGEAGPFSFGHGDVEGRRQRVFPKRNHHSCPSAALFDHHVTMTLACGQPWPSCDGDDIA